MTLKDLVRQAEENAGDFTLDNFFQYIFDSIKSQQKFAERASESYARFAAMDLEKIYEDYAASINQPALTVEEKQQAILEHVLNEGEGE